MINILNMNFPDDTAIDIGSIKFDRYRENLHLLADKFYFQSGDVAIVDDTQRAFVYNADSDSWTEWDI